MEWFRLALSRRTKVKEHNNETANESLIYSSSLVNYRNALLCFPNQIVTTHSSPEEICYKWLWTWLVIEPNVWRLNAITFYPPLLICPINQIINNQMLMTEKHRQRNGSLPKHSTPPPPALLYFTLKTKLGGDTIRVNSFGNKTPPAGVTSVGRWMVDTRLWSLGGIEVCLYRVYRSHHSWIPRNNQPH